MNADWTTQANRIRNVKFGTGVIVYEPVNLYDCELGDNSFVGPFVEIQSDVKIGQRTRIQSHSFLSGGLMVGNDCFIGHGVMFTNDRFSNGRPAMGDKSLWEMTVIGDRVSIGSNSTLLPVSICSDVVVGAGSVVTKNISEPGVYAGNPARLIRRL